MRLYSILWRIAGEDVALLKQSDATTKLKFATVGLLLVLCFAMGVTSFSFVFNQLFDIGYSSYAFGCIATLLFFNLYRLCLISLYLGDKKKGGAYYFSVSIRLILLMLIAFFVVKPLEYEAALKMTNIEANLAEFRKEEIKNHLQKITNYYDGAISNAKDTYEKIKLQTDKGQISLDTEHLLYLKSKVSKLKATKQIQITETEKLLRDTNFFIKNVVRLNKERKHIWFFTFLLVFVYLLPFLIKLTHSHQNEYALISSQIMKNIIVDEYTMFKKQYSIVFKRGVDIDIEYKERFLDPPFNLELIGEEKLKMGSTKDFLTTLYGDNS